MRLADHDPRDTGGRDKRSAVAEMDADRNALGELQELLYVAATHGVLIVLQGMDASGKDGSIRHVFSAVNPAGSRVVSFKVPTEEELSHDYLWRIHNATPRRGEITIFNRSHYESVLVERIKHIASKKVWSQRYDQINHFEALLASEGTVILKFFLNISKDEQLQRLNERVADPVKRWKVNASDWEDRGHWDEFQQAYQEAIERTSTHHAPWTIVPADRKWMRNLVIASTIREKLEPFRDRWKNSILELGEKRLAALRATQDVQLAESEAAGRSRNTTEEPETEPA